MNKKRVFLTGGTGFVGSNIGYQLLELGYEVIFLVREVAGVNTGIGISKKDMSKLFKKISRLNNAISICPDGTGLGLFIAKGMIEKHGGKVEAKSDGENKGSEFAFCLPIQ